MRTPHEHTVLGDECIDAVSALRSALIDLYAVLEMDPAEPQELSRRFGINKNLTWKVSKIIGATDGFSAVAHLPGASGWEIFLTALNRGAGTDEAIARVRAALERFDEFVAVHAGGRGDLELILDSMGAAGNGNAPLETSRQLAYQGNSGVWGVQAKVRTATGFVTLDGEDQSRVKIALVGGFVGFRRLRPRVPWPLFRFWTYRDDGAQIETRSEPIETRPRPGDPPELLRSFCSETLPEIRTTQIGDVMEYSLTGGEVGNLGAFTCFFGAITHGCPRYRGEGHEHGEFAASINLPVETLLFDVYIDDRIAIAAPPEVLVYGRPQGGVDGPEGRREEYRLPLSERCVELPGGGATGRPPALATPLAPRLGELVSMVQGRMAAPETRWRGFRLVMKYPPMMSAAVLRWPLEQAP